MGSLGTIKLRSRFSGNKRNMLSNGGILLEELLHSCDGKCNPLQIFSAQELAKATNNYREQLAKGSYYNMYMGFFNGRRILVKSMKSGDKDEFEISIEMAINEIVFAAQVSNHKNMLMLLGCCLETEVPMLVYESADNGALTNHIRATSKKFQKPLPWDCRLKVAKEIADSLAYLHIGLSTPIIHRSIEPSKIYLDGNYVAKLTDFSLCISIPSGEEYIEADELIGTYGYVAPEYIATNKLTEKCDVYSFGSLLFEILSGKRVTSFFNYDYNVRRHEFQSILASTDHASMTKGVQARHDHDFVAANQRSIGSVSISNLLEVHRSDHGKSNVVDRCGCSTSCGQSSTFQAEDKPHLHQFIIDTAKTYMGPDIMLEDQWKLLMAWKLASRCLKARPDDRPTMKEVAQEIRRIIRFQCNSP